MGGTGRPLGKTFFLQCQRRHPQLPKIPTYLPTSDEDMEDKIKLLDQRLQKLIRTYLEVFGELPPPASCDKLVQMDLKLKPELVGHKIRRRPYPAPKEQADEIERQIQNVSTLA